MSSLGTSKNFAVIALAIVGAEAFIVCAQPPKLNATVAKGLVGWREHAISSFAGWQFESAL